MRYTFGGVAAVFGGKALEERAPVDETRLVDDLVDGELGRGEQLLGLGQPVLLDDVGRGLVQDAFQTAVEVADAYAHLVGDEFRRDLRVGNVVVD